MTEQPEKTLRNDSGIHQAMAWLFKIRSRRLVEKKGIDQSGLEDLTSPEWLDQFCRRLVWMKVSALIENQGLEGVDVEKVKEQIEMLKVVPFSGILRLLSRSEYYKSRPKNAKSADALKLLDLYLVSAGVSTKLYDKENPEEQTNVVALHEFWFLFFAGLQLISPYTKSLWFVLNHELNHVAEAVVGISQGKEEARLRKLIMFITPKLVLTLILSVVSGLVGVLPSSFYFNASIITTLIGINTAYHFLPSERRANEQGKDGENMQE